MGLLSTEVNIKNEAEKKPLILKKEKDGSVILCQRCQGSGQFEDYTTSCMGRHYFERTCPVCSGVGALKIMFRNVKAVK